MKNGIWTNKNSITLKNNGTSYSSLGANTCTLTGAIYCTANGQTGMNFKPAAAGNGNANILGVSNAYNRVRVRAMSRDSTASWTRAAGATYGPVNVSVSNRITFVDCLRQSSIGSTYFVVCNGTAAGANVGIDLDSTINTPDVTPQGNVVATTTILTLHTQDIFSPQLGVHYVQAVEGNASATVTFFGAQSIRQLQALTIDLEM